MTERSDRDDVSSLSSFGFCGPTDDLTWPTCCTSLWGSSFDRQTDAFVNFFEIASSFAEISQIMQRCDTARAVYHIAGGWRLCWDQIDMHGPVTVYMRLEHSGNNPADWGTAALRWTKSWDGFSQRCGGAHAGYLRRYCYQRGTRVEAGYESSTPPPNQCMEALEVAQTYITMAVLNHSSEWHYAWGQMWEQQLCRQNESG